jgi:hypothetical protein
VTNLLDGFAVDVSRDYEMEVLSLPRSFASRGARAWTQWGVAHGCGLAWRVSFLRKNS